MMVDLRSVTHVNMNTTEYRYMVDEIEEVFVVRRIKGAKDTPYAIYRKSIRGLTDPIARVLGTHQAEAFIEKVFIPAIAHTAEVVAKLRGDQS